MTIVINTCGQGTDVRYSHFIYEVFTTIAVHQPDISFYIYGNGDMTSLIEFPENLTYVQVRSESYPVLGGWWNRLKLDKKIKQTRPDVFVIVNELRPSRMKIPQYLLIPGGDFIMKNGLKKAQNIISGNLQSGIRILTFTQATKDALSTKGNKNIKLKVVPPGLASAAITVNKEMEQEIKDQYTSGKEYFVCIINEQQTGGLIILLKAYSVFKRRQRSNMKMLLIGQTINVYGNCLKLLSNYKYREDVILKNYNGPEEQEKVIKSAFAIIYLSPEYYDGNVLEAMDAGIPALVPAGSSMAEIASDSVLYFNMSEFEGLAEQLMLIYKDEDRKNKLISAGKKRSAAYSRQRTATALWESLAESINDKHLP